MKRRDLLMGGMATPLSAALIQAQTPSRYPPPQGAPGAPLADPNLKLAVLSGLLDVGAIDLGEPWDLAAHVLGRPWDYETEGYDAIPEALDYLYRYPLTDDLLSRAQHLYLDGGNAIYPYVWYFWDGESEDFDISSFAGLTQCRNLRKIEVIAMTKGSIDLGDLRGLDQVAEISLSGRFSRFEALLDLPALASLTMHQWDIDQTPAGEAVFDRIQSLRSRGVAVTIY